MNYILDGILIAIAVTFIVISRRKGFLSASKSIIALVLTAMLLASMQETILTALQASPVYDGVRTVVAKRITKTYDEKQISGDVYTDDTENSNEVCEALALPSFMENSLKKTMSQMTELKNNVMEVITDSITNMILNVIGMILVFLAVRLLVFLIIKVLESLFKLPGLKSINRFLGTILGIINALLVIYLVCGGVSLFAPAEKMQMINDAIQKTYIVKYFYDNNLLLSLFV